MITMNVVEAKARFSELLARVAYGRERIIIARRGKPMAAVINLEDLARLERANLGSTRPPIARAADLDRAALLAEIEAGRLHPTMAAFGLWADDPEFETLTERIYANRERQAARTVVLE